jgi:hypothetical protein
MNGLEKANRNNEPDPVDIGRHWFRCNCFYRLRQKSIFRLKESEIEQPGRLENSACPELGFTCSFAAEILSEHYTGGRDACCQCRSSVRDHDG